MKLVKHLDAKTATAVVCDNCDWRGDDEDPCDGLVANRLVPCPKCGAGTVEYEFVEADECASCGILTLDLPVRDQHGGYCSRVCMLQAEWKRKLDA